MVQKIWLNKTKRIRRELAREFEMWPEEYTNVDFTKDRLDDIKNYLNESVEAGGLDTVDEVTWNDLDMDEIFLRVNHTRSFVGEQVLYKKLRTRGECPCVLEEHISYLSDNPEKRIDLEKGLQIIGKQKDDYYLPMILSEPGLWRISGGLVYNLLQIALIFLLVMTLVTGNALWFALTVAVGVTNLTISMLIKSKYEPLLFSIGSIKQMTRLCKLLEKDKELATVFLTGQLKAILKVSERISKSISNFQIRKNYYMTGELGGLLLDYIMGISLHDILTFNRIIKLLERQKEDIYKLYELVGQIDVEIAVASFRNTIKNWCVPDCGADKIIAKDVIHPAVNKCVSNTLIIENGIMLTGANASGKSTFMKALAVNVILSQTVNTACAKSFAIPDKLTVMSSMALRDDIKSGESYYIREINQLKKMVDAINMDTPTLIFIDEILRGTNSVERVSASYGVLDYLWDKNVFVVVATHDISLVNLVKDRYRCYYFSSNIVDGELELDYKLHNGVNSKSNAIQLLEMTGFPREIIESSKLQITSLEKIY